MNKERSLLYTAAHGSITFKPWLPVYIHKYEVAVPKCVSLERGNVRFPNNL